MTADLLRSVLLALAFAVPPAWPQDTPAQPAVEDAFRKARVEQAERELSTNRAAQQVKGTSATQLASLRKRERELLQLIQSLQGKPAS